MSGGLVRIILHWTAGGPRASMLDKQHYHWLVQQDGTVVAGNLPAEANISTKDGSYAAHTLNCNTGSIGVGFCGMVGAMESPFHAGSSPLTPDQIEAGCMFVASVAERYRIPVTRQSVLTHAEVSPTLGIKQRGKWDIAWLPGMARPGKAVDVGDALRATIQKYNRKG